MNERDENSVVNETFEKLIEASQVRDAGIVRFEDSLADVRDFLVNKYIEHGAPLNDAEISKVTSELEKGWTHTGDTAWVSGRVYLLDDDYEDQADRELGESSLDEDDVFYYAENVKLRSEGIIINPIYVEDELEDFRVAYVYGFENTEVGEDQLYAYPDELSRHDYARPTPFEAEVRLENEWSRQLEIIERLIFPDGQINLPQRLTKMTRDLQKELQKSKEFKELVEIYIDYFLSLDTKLPYVIALEGEIECFDGDNPDSPKDNEKWNTIVADETMSLLGFIPSFRLVENKQGEVEAMFIMATYNAEDGDEEQYIRVSTASIREFRSTRSVKSLITKAFEGSDLMNSPVFKPDNDDETLGEAIAGALEEPSLRYKEFSFHKTDIELIAEQKEIDAAIRKIQSIVKTARKTVYATLDEAKAASKKITLEDIREIMASLHFSHPYKFEVSGPGVRIPNRSLNLKTDDKESIYTIRLDNEKPLISLPPEATHTGIITGATPSIEIVGDENGVVSGYVASPSFAVTLHTIKQPILKVDDLEMVTTTTDGKAIVALDGTADIRLPGLDSYIETQDRLKNISFQYGKNPLVKRLGTLRDIIFRDELPNQFVDLKHVKLISRMGGAIHEFSQNGGETKDIMNFLEALFVNGTFGIHAKLYKSNDGTMELADKLASDESYQVNVLDIRDDLFEGDLAFAFAHTEHGVVYAPFSSITQFRF